MHADVRKSFQTARAPELKLKINFIQAMQAALLPTSHSATNSTIKPITNMQAVSQQGLFKFLTSIVHMFMYTKTSLLRCLVL